jgi:hypothetical protein
MPLSADSTAATSVTTGQSVVDTLSCSSSGNPSSAEYCRSGHEVLRDKEICFGAEMEQSEKARSTILTFLVISK